jgi:hypothetical protein
MPRLPGRPRRGHEPPPARGVVDAEVRGSLQRGRGGRVPAAAARPLRRLLELVGEPGVRPGRGERTVPGTLVRVELPRQGVGEREVRGAAVARRRRLVDRRPHERVTHLERRAADVDEPGLLRGRQRVGLDAAGPCGVEHRCEPARVVRRHQQQRPLRRLRQAAHLLPEQALDVARQRQGRWQRVGAGQLAP